MLEICLARSAAASSVAVRNGSCVMTPPTIGQALPCRPQDLAASPVVCPPPSGAFVLDSRLSVTAPGWWDLRSRRADDSRRGTGHCLPDKDVSSVGRGRADRLG